MMRRSLTLFSILCSLFSLSYSQPGLGAPRGRQQERLEQLKKIQLMEFMKLDEETSIRFFSRYGEHQEEVRSIVEKRSKAIDDLWKKMENDGEDVDYDKFVDQTISMEKEIISSREKFLRGLGDILTKRQVAQYVVFERRFNQNVRQMLQEMNQRRRRF